MTGDRRRLPFRLNCGHTLCGPCVSRKKTVLACPDCGKKAPYDPSKSPEEQLVVNVHSLGVTADPDNPLDIYAVHTVFLPKIQCKLDLFQSGWANHRMRTEHNWSPIHLWIEGLRSLQSRNPNHCIIFGGFGVPYTTANVHHFSHVLVMLTVCSLAPRPSPLCA